jgi:endonuclease/exonuclease/phosphatase family metal-dependent hydrolase
MRLGTFNARWLGTPDVRLARRDADDERALGRLLGGLDADAWVLEEVVSLPLAARLLDDGSGGRRAFRLRDDAGRWLTTGRVRHRVSRLQKVAFAHDARTLALVEWGPLRRKGAPEAGWPGPRSPIVARLRPAAGGPDLTVVGVHLKSGAVGEPPEARSAVVRARECEALAAHLAALPPDEPAVLLGDFNAVRGHPSLAPLGALCARGWAWPEPRFEPDRAGERWTSFARRTVIDHALLSPAAAARLVGPPRVACFDLDPAFDYCPSGNGHFLRRKTDLRLEPGENEPPELVENLYRLSDHRPLVVELD